MDFENAKLPSETNVQLLDIPAEEDRPCEDARCDNAEESMDSVKEPGGELEFDNLDTTSTRTISTSPDNNVAGSIDQYQAGQEDVSTEVAAISVNTVATGEDNEHWE